MIYLCIKQLIEYGISTGLMKEEDRIYITNKLLAILELDDYEDIELQEAMSLEEILRHILDFAVAKELVEDTITSRDLFDTKLMDAVMPRPSEVVEAFNHQYKVSAQAATDYYYALSKDSDYIRQYRVCKDLKWKTKTQYGNLDITINLSRPEKDPRDIAAARNAKQSSYPKCLLCLENEGYAGRINHPARQNHRIIPITIDGEKWGFQYSPYIYYNEHCIVLNGKHVPMKIEKRTFAKLFDFVKAFPHYFVGSNADLPIVGGSILSHDHFQGGNYEFPMAKAQIETSFIVPGYEAVEAGIVKWPMSVIRLRGESSDELVNLGDVILRKWRDYTDKGAFIFSQTEATGELHNTITPIARKSSRDGKFELDLVLRNNITTKEYPDGVYHPHQELHHIKKENIGLIEVMGLAVLPARLKQEMELIATCIAEGRDIRQEETLIKHAEWFDQIKALHSVINEGNIDEILQTEIGKAFELVLEHAGVYKNQASFMKFIESVIMTSS